MATIITRAGKGTPLTHPEVDANFTNLNTDKLESGSTAASLTITSVDINGGTIDGAVIGGAVPAAGTFTTATVNGNIVVTGTVDGRDVATDGTKLDGIEAGADVTDTANVTAAGALMDSELTNEAAVKALNQGVATTDSPTFAGLTVGSVDSTEISYLNGVTSAIQTQLNSKFAIAGGALTGAAQGSTQTASITGSTTLDFATYQNFVLTLTGNVTLANPTTEVVGQSGFIVFVQDGTGGRTVSLGTDFETAGGAGLALSAAASATDIVPYIVAASGRILLGAPQLAFA